MIWTIMDMIWRYERNEFRHSMDWSRMTPRLQSMKWAGRGAIWCYSGCHRCYSVAIQLKPLENVFPLSFLIAITNNIALYVFLISSLERKQTMTQFRYMWEDRVYGSLLQIQFFEFRPIFWEQLLWNHRKARNLCYFNYQFHRWAAKSATA